MGIFDRLSQVLKGKASNAVSGVEANNPEAVYEAAILAREQKYGELKKSVAGIIHLRDRAQEDLATSERELAQVTMSVGAAVESGEDEAALALLEQKEALTGKVAALTEEIANLEGQVAEAKSGLTSYRDDIARLKREKTEMLAKNATADARIQIQETMDGLSTDADVQGLSNVRENIRAMADDAGLDDVRPRVSDGDLARIRAKAKLAEMKRKMSGEPDPEDAPTVPAEADAAPDDDDTTPTPEDDVPKRTL